jgi:predicted transcriptional regulator of viral defense system
MRKESFKSAEQLIKNHLYTDDLKAYTTFDLTKIFQNKREEWNIADYRNQYHFMKFLEDANILKNIKLKHQSTATIKQIYEEPNASLFNIALTIKKDGYLSNYTAMQIHQLTLQIPKSIYVSYNKGHSYPINPNDIELEQSSIDSAFSKAQRITSESYKSEIDNTRFYFIQKGYIENNVGITSENGYSYTDLERTLIDIAIRPAYSGGVFEVLEAYEIAREKVDIFKINEYLLKLNYIYPYHQLIGFYMTKAGYDQKIIDDIFKKNITYNFYLTYNMSNKEFDSKWKIFYPKGF